MSKDAVVITTIVVSALLVGGALYVARENAKTAAKAGKRGPLESLGGLVESGVGYIGGLFG